ncbi:hypothetical protein KSS87_012389 [Heliosperma pusillum]|nr:hypothetical protein KSS87_012389 [Heliosperma pusillum]
MRRRELHKSDFFLIPIPRIVGIVIEYGNWSKSHDKHAFFKVSAAAPPRYEGCGKFAQTSTRVRLVDLHPTET